MITAKYRAYIESLDVIIESVDLYADGSIGLSEDNLLQSASIILYSESGVVTDMQDNHLMNVRTGESYVWIDQGDYHLMQFIGKSGTDGKDIYTGDIIIESIGVDQEFYVVFWDDRNSRFAMLPLRYAQVNAPDFAIAVNPSISKAMKAIGSIFTDFNQPNLAEFKNEYFNQNI